MLEYVIIFLITTDDEKQYYCAVKGLSRLLYGITLKYNGIHCFMNCFHSFRTESKLKSQENVCKNHDYYHTQMPAPYNKILKFNQEQKHIKIPFFIYVHMEPNI